MALWVRHTQPFGNTTTTHGTGRMRARNCSKSITALGDMFKIVEATIKKLSQCDPRLAKTLLRGVLEAISG